MALLTRFMTTLRELVPTDLKVTLARQLCRPEVGSLVGRVFDDRVPNWGCRIDTSSPRVSPTAKASLFWRVYEGAEIRFLREHLRCDLDVIEVGSSIGVVSCHIRRRLESGRKLVAVEADPELAKVAVTNLEDNGGPADFEVVNCAIAYGCETVRFATSASNVSGKIAGEGASDVIEVRATTMRQLVGDHDLGDFAWVADIEGAEAQVLAGDGDIIKEKCRQILIELHPTVLDGHALTVDDLVDRIRDLGFRIRAKHGPVMVFDSEH